MIGTHINITGPYRAARLCRVASILLVSVAMRAVGQPVDVVVQTVEEEALAGRLVSFSIDDGLVLDRADSPERVDISAADVVKIATSAKKSAPSAGLVTVTLIGGDIFVGTITGFVDEHVLIESSLLGVVRVPLEFIATWRSPRAAQPRWKHAANQMLARPSAGVDRLLLGNGDQVEGIVTEINDQTFLLQTKSGDVRIDQDRIIAATIVAAEIVHAPGPNARVSLIDGSSLTTSKIRWTGDDVWVDVLGDGLGLISGKSILCVEIEGGRWQWLTAIAPISVESTPMLAIRWPYTLNRNVMNGPLRVASRTFQHGFGVHSRSMLAFELGGGYTELVMYYGIDDHSGAMADVDMAVRVDGRIRHDRRSLQRGTLVGPVRIDVAGANRVELIVEFGRHGGIQDRFDWIEPALVR